MAATRKVEPKGQIEGASNITKKFSGCLSETIEFHTDARVRDQGKGKLFYSWALAMIDIQELLTVYTTYKAIRQKKVV